MGEYAKYRGTDIKIGTCENMYYLRADQAHLVTPVPGSLDPNDPEVQKEIRFRFPFPDEDAIEPGAFAKYDRSIRCDGVTAPVGVDHGKMQFTSNYPRTGYLVSLPCPEGPDADPRVGRNGYQGATLLCQQRYWDGLLVGVFECGGCGHKWRAETYADALPAVDALLSEAQRRIHDARVGPHYRNDDGTYDEASILYQGRYWLQIAQRLAAGYGVTLSDLATV